RRLLASKISKENKNVAFKELSKAELTKLGGAAIVRPGFISTLASWGEICQLGQLSYPITNEISTPKSGAPTQSPPSSTPVMSEETEQIQRLGDMEPKSHMSRIRLP
ncbi:unnamed protein product, partial [Ectocarpus sp. 12 AP-2014]